MRTFTVYIMASRSRVLYVGVTNDLARRVNQHKRGPGPSLEESSFGKGRRPPLSPGGSLTPKPLLANIRLRSGRTRVRAKD